MSATVHDTMINCQSAHSAPRHAPLLDAVTRTLRLWRARRAERHAFPTGLDERQLHDLRLSRWELDRELRKPFWRG